MGWLWLPSSLPVQALACVRISPRVRPLPYMYFNAGWNIATCVASQTRKELMILTWCCSHMSIYCCTISVYKCISRILERFIFEAILFKKSSGHRRHLPWLRGVSAFPASPSHSSLFPIPTLFVSLDINIQNQGRIIRNRFTLLLQNSRPQ